ncbi:hypothetical protein Sjap_003666 [Stephania japonica]|uniref:X8 domain-containing protein n=1 Tax=Stephania japonica TaxID=461633 RepID=A0AAP0KP85_9MAGN
MKLSRQCKWLHSVLIFFCIAATVFTHSEARLSKHKLIKGTQNLNHLRSPTTKRLKHFKHFEIDPQSDPGNTQPYVSSPFSLPPFESLGPMPLSQNAPPYCENPPSSQQPPSATLPSPTTYPTPPAPPFSSYPTPTTPSQSPPSSPIGGEAQSPPTSPTLPGTGPSVPGTNPPEGSPNPSPPWYGPSPPEVIFPGAPPLFPGPPETGPGTGVPSPSPPSYIPLPPYYGSNPPGIVPSPPSYVPGSPGVVPSPPIYIPSPPSYGSNPPGTTPSPPQYAPYPPPYFPNPPTPTGFLPSPPVFLPPVVYPPPLRPPTPNSGPHLTLWCVAKPSVPDPIIQEAMDYACFSGADCGSIEPSGSCFEPNNLAAHASYAFNSYWQRTKAGGGTCDFGGTAILVTVDPSFDGCIFLRY